jgi:hypothetical protein
MLSIAKAVRPGATRRVSYAVRGTGISWPCPHPSLSCFSVLQTKPSIHMIHNLLDSKAEDVPSEIQMLCIFSSDAVIVSPAAMLSSRGNRPLGCIRGLKAFLTR